MQKPITLLECLLKDAAVQCSTSYDSRDLDTIVKRVNHEGLQFIAIALPAYLSELMKCLESGEVTPHSFPGWKKNGGLPCFLKGFLGLIFREDGRLKDATEQQKLAIRSVRQLCSAYKKPKQLCSTERISEALMAYEAIDDDMRISLPDSDEVCRYMDVSAYVVSSVFKDFDPYTLVPKHGPGATADRVNGNKKYSQKHVTWFERFNQYFCKGECLYNTEESEALDTVCVKTCTANNEEPARLSVVPKTMLTPRVIALEPATMQMMQQPVKDYLVSSLESHPLTKGHVNFTSQAINRQLALKNSLSREMGTVDLSAASDRVSKEQIYLLFSVYPLLRDVIFTVRSKRVLINGQSRELNKFASMGSALCFPCEALHFFVLCICSILKNRNLPTSPSNISSVAKRVYVYGDDIIVPANEVESLSHYMAQFKAKVGLDKTFYRGLFRESCGMDAYAGMNVTPVYIRHTFPSNSRDHARILSYVESCNQFFENGYEETAQFIKNSVESIVGEIPTVESTCPGIGWRFGNFVGKRRYSKKLQRAEVRTLVPTIKPEKDEIDGYAALHKCLLKLESGKTKLDRSYPVSYRRAALHRQQQVDYDHLSRSYGLGALTLKPRWVSPH